MRQSDNSHVLGPVESECEGEEVNAVDAVPHVFKKGVVRTKPDEDGEAGNRKRKFHSCRRRRHAGVRSGRQGV